MAKRRRGRHDHPAIPAAGGDEGPIDVVRIGQGVGDFETINGLPQGILTAGLVVATLLLLRPIARAFRAFLRG